MGLNELQAANYTRYIQLCEEYNQEPIDWDVYHWESHFKQLEELDLGISNGGRSIQ